MASKGCKICSIVTGVMLIIVAIVVVTLSLTIFKVKDPIVSVHPVGLDEIDFFAPNASLTMVITMVNPNYGAFEAMDAIGYLRYRDIVIAESPLAKRTIPPHSTVNVTTTAGLHSQKLIDDDRFITDLEDSSYNLTSSALLPGNVHMLISFKAMVNISCDIAVNVTTMTSESSCIAKLKF